MWRCCCSWSGRWGGSPAASPGSGPIPGRRRSVRHLTMLSNDEIRSPHMNGGDAARTTSRLCATPGWPRSAQWSPRSAPTCTHLLRAADRGAAATQCGSPRTAAGEILVTAVDRRPTWSGALGLRPRGPAAAGPCAGRVGLAGPRGGRDGASPGGAIRIEQQSTWPSWCGRTTSSCFVCGPYFARCGGGGRWSRAHLRAPGEHAARG